MEARGEPVPSDLILCCIGHQDSLFEDAVLTLSAIIMLEFDTAAEHRQADVVIC